MKHTHDHTHHAETVRGFTITRGEKSTITITGEIPYEFLEEERSGALTALGKDIELKGFRKGHVPENILVKHIGEMALLQEMADRALRHLYGHILEEHTLDPIGRPEISVTKLAPGNPFGFSMKLSLLPHVELPDYTAIAHEHNSKKSDVSVEDIEVDEAIVRLQRQKIAYDRLQEKAQKKAELEKDGLTLPTPETVETPETDLASVPLPELTDAYVGTLGSFANVADFKAQVKAGLLAQKQEETQNTLRSRITDELVLKSTIDLPEILTEAEVNQMFAEMDAELSRAGLTMEQYLDHMKKTKEDMAREWMPTAEKRAKMQLIINEIAKRESIRPSADDVARESSKILEAYKDADPSRVHVYVASTLQNAEVMKFLESR